MRSTPGGEYPHIKDYAYIVPFNEHSCQIGTVSGKGVFIDSDFVTVHDVVSLLDGRNNINEIKQLASQKWGLHETWIESFLQHLDDASLLEHESRDHPDCLISRDRYQSQLRFFSIFSTPTITSHDMLEKLRSKCAVVIGAGGIGCHALAALALSGIGELVVVDYDTITRSNLNRQILYKEGDVGQAKDTVACRELQRINPDVSTESRRIQVSSPSDARRAIKGADVVLCTADFPYILIYRWINQACIESQIPWTQVNMGESVCTLGPLVVPRETGCFGCLEEQYRSRNSKYDFQIDMFLSSDEGNEATYHKRSATLGACVGVAGNLAAWEIIRYLVGIHDTITLGYLVTLDVLTMSLHREPVERVPQCPVCSS